MHMALSTERFSPSFERSDEEAQHHHHHHHPAGASLLIDASHLSRTALSLSGERRGSPALQHQSVSQPSRKRKLHSSPHHSPQSPAESSLSPASQGAHSHAEEESDDTDGSTYDPDPSYQDTSRIAFSSNKRARKAYNTSASFASRGSAKQAGSGRLSPPHSKLSPSSLESSAVPVGLTATSAAQQTSAHLPATSADNWAYRNTAQQHPYLTAHHPHSTWQSTYASAPPSFVEAGSRYSGYHPQYSSSQHHSPALSSAPWNMQSPRFVDDRPAVAPASISRPWPPSSHASLDANAQQQPDPPAFSIRPGPVQKKRGKLPEEAISVMKAWLFANTHHPYPSDSQKREMCSQTGLSPQQVSNWFINARRRILKRGNDDWPPQTQAGDSVSPEMPPAGVKYDKVPTELEGDAPPARASPTYGSNPPAGYAYNAPYGGQRNSPPQGSPIYRSQQPSSYAYQMGEQPQPYLPPPGYPFGRPASQQGYYHSSRDGGDSFARYGSSHFRSSPYLRPPQSQDERPSQGHPTD